MSEEEKKLEERKKMNAPFIRAFEWYRQRHNLTQKKMSELLRCNSPLISDYKNGKKKAFQALFGGVMRELRGNGDPAVITELLNKMLGE